MEGDPLRRPAPVRTPNAPLPRAAPPEEPPLPRVPVEEKLYLVQYRHDRHSHIDITHREVCAEQCGRAWGRPCTTFCPANVYTWDGEKIVIAYENCVECTSCLLGCPYRVIDWRLPRGGFGVHYRFG